MNLKKYTYLIGLFTLILVLDSCNDDDSPDDMAPTSAFDNWTLIPSDTGADLNAIHFFNEEKGYCSGSFTKTLETLDGGASWTKGTSQGFKDFSFFDDTYGYAASVVGMSMGITTDGGATWMSLNPVNSNSLWGVSASSKTTAHFVGTGGVLWKTTNSGVTFTVIDVGVANQTPNLIPDIYFVNETTGYLVAQLGEIKKTVDGGNTYNTVFSNLDFSFTETHFVNENVGFVVGGGNSKGVVVGTTDAGANWEVLLSTGSAFLTGVHFHDENNGIVVGLNGKILHTTDGGLTWETPSSGVTTDLRDVRMLSAVAAIVVGDEGVILKNE